MSPSLRGVVHGGLLAAGRLASRGAFVGAATILAALITALVERALGPIGALDRSLAILASFIHPLAAAALVTAALGLRTPRDLAWPVARYGAPRAAVVAGVLAVLSIAAALLAAASGAVVVFVAHASISRDAPLAGDAVTTAGVSALAAWAYASMLTFAATFGRRGGGRAIALALDFLIGSLGVVGFLLPRGHAANLLGVAAFVLSQRGSSIALVAMALAWSALALVRSRD